MRWLGLMVSLAFALPAYGKGAECPLLLWSPESLLARTPRAVSPEVISVLREEAQRALAVPPAPVPKLRSSGVKDPKDSVLLASRRAFQDADRAVILALAHRLTGDPSLSRHGGRILTSWAEVNDPTGHPIDETRLDGLVWAYDLLRCELGEADRQSVLRWLERMRERKRAWPLGPATRFNNHRTHQLKMLLLLDKAIGDREAWEGDRLEARRHVGVNLNLVTGESRDYVERGALFYHVYNLEAWLEIALMGACCVDEAAKAFQFLREKIVADHIHGEFLHSEAPLDEERGQTGFSYAEKGGTYDTSRAVRTILTYYTLVPDAKKDPSLWSLVLEANRGQRNVFPWVRYFLWKKP